MNCQQTLIGLRLKWLRFCMLFLVSLTMAACGNSAEQSEPEDSGTLVVLNKTGNTAMIIDLATRELLATLPTGVAPHEAVVSPDKRWVAASNYGLYDGDPGHTITLINVEEQSVERVIDMGEYIRPHGMVWMSDGEHLLVTAEEHESLILLHIPSGEVVREIPTGGQYRSHIVYLSSDESTAYVANIDDGTMSVIDMESGDVITVIETGEGAEGIGISPDETELWISNRVVNTITIVDLDTYEVIDTLPAGEFPIRSVFTPDGSHVVVANMNGGDLSVFDASGRSEVMRIDLEPDRDLNAAPVGLMVIPGNRLLAAGTQSDRLYMIDLENFEIIDHIEAGDEPDGMAFIE
ncbi:MAG: beta-propeller fold lactonase family protein [Balneolaceae bacterium]